MTKEEFIAVIELQKERGGKLLRQVQQMHVGKNNFGDGTAVFGTPSLYFTPKEELEPVEAEYESWKCYVHDFLQSVLDMDDAFISEWDSCLKSPYRHDVPDRDWYTTEINKALAKLVSFEQRIGFRFKESTMIQETVKQEKNDSQKPPKVFISHKKEDKDYADALVTLINFIIGPDGDKIFCSSVPGYGIKQSCDIMDELKAQFDNYEIFMVIIHSPRYYQSAVCLNEMGASWVLGTKFASFMTLDCEYKHMRGVINQEQICINLNDDKNVLNAHLNDFKNDLITHFGRSALDDNKWETAREHFVKEVSTMTYFPIGKDDVNLFELWYLPAFDYLFELIDMDHFQHWAYSCAIGGDTILSAAVFENFGKVTNYIMSRPRHQEYASWDTLMRNLGLLIADFDALFSQHAEKLDDKRYWVERFYKRIPNNPNYDKDLAAYNEYILLVSDMVFELARLCNLILSRIRIQHPEYKKEVGILHIDNDITTPDLVYSKAEISDAPYPGLKEYIKVRLTRNTHLGNTPNINESGY